MEKVQKLGEVLLSIGAVSAVGLSRALMLQRSTGGRLGTILLEQGIVTEETLARALSKSTGRSYAHWDRVKNAPRELVALLPAKIAIRAAAVPFDREGRVLRVAMRDPYDLAAEDELALVTGRKIEPWSIAEFRLAEALERFYGERRSARFRVLSERLERGIRPAGTPPPVPPPPPPDLRGDGRSTLIPETAIDTHLPADARPSDVWRISADALNDEIEIATWRPVPLARSAPPPVFSALDFLPDESEEITTPLEAPVAAGDPGRPASPETEAAAEAVPPPVPEAETSTVVLAGEPQEPAAGSPTEAPPHSAPLPSPPPEARPRPRPPASIAEARERIRSAETRDDIADAALAYLEPAFPLVALFIARKEDVIGWQARGAGVSKSAFKAIRVSFRDPSIFLNVKLSASPYQGRLPDLPSHAALMEAFGHAPESCAVLPITMKKRVVAFLFLELSGPVLAAGRSEDMKALGAAVADGLAALILQQRARL